MRIARKSITFLLFFAILISLGTGCSNNRNTDDVLSSGIGLNNSRTAEEAAAHDPVTLVTVSMYGGTDANAGNYQALNEQFMKDYPYITVEDDSQTADQDWKTKIAADFAVGNEPDVIQYFTDANASDVLAADKFVTIEDIRTIYPEYAGDTLDLALTAAANPDGIERAVPTTGYWEGLFCNKDLFDQYRLELPTNWDKLLTAIRVFNENGIIPIAVSLNNVPHYWIEFLILASAGPKGYAIVPEEAPEDWCRGLDMFKALRDLGAFPANTDTIDNDYAGNLFKNKEAAMQLDGSWYLSGIPDQKNTVLVSFPVIPGGKAQPGFMVGGISSGFYITKKAWNDSDKRDAAVKFVMAHTSSEAVQIYWNGNGQAAAVVRQAENMTALGISGMKYSQAATSISSPTDSWINQEAYNTLVEGIVDLSTGAITSEDLINKVLSINARR